LLSAGRVVFTRQEAESELGISTRAFLDAAERQQRHNHLISPRRGFYVIVPPQFHSWGAPPPSWYIDRLMQHEGHAYYVGLLKAAELHGATHQAVMEFQVVSDKRLPRLRAGRSTIVFYYRRDLPSVSEGLEDHKTDTGRMRISGLELTLLDLLRYPHAGGGLDTIANVVTELGGRADPNKLAMLSVLFERTVNQRLGYLLDRCGHYGRTAALYRFVMQNAPLPWIELEPSQTADRDFRVEPAERNNRWRVIVRSPPQPDE
jgi:predicted transcriptional regulator of viral defense system